jgi:hypothetical protein
MNITIPKECATATAATLLIGGPVLGLSRLAAASISYITAIAIEDSIQDAEYSCSQFLRENNYLSVFGQENKDTMRHVAKTVVSIALNSLALFVTMYAASYFLPIDSFSPIGALASSTLAKAQTIYTKIICPLLCSTKADAIEFPPLTPLRTSNPYYIQIQNGIVGFVESDAFIELTPLNRTGNNTMYNATAEGQLFLVANGRVFWVRSL